MMDLLGNNKSRIAITTDMWTSYQKKGYMVITAHFIDDAWILQSRVLRYSLNNLIYFYVLLKFNFNFVILIFFLLQI